VKNFLLIILCLAVFVFFRFWGLTDSCLWFDEIFSIHAAQMPLPEMWRFLSLDQIHPPLFYVLLKLWITLGGESLFWLRLFPVFFSLLTIPAIIGLRNCCALAERRVPPFPKDGSSIVMLASWILFFAVNGALLKYGQEARMYSMLVCFAAWSLWFFFRWLDGRAFSLAPLFLINLLLVYTHYFGWLVVLTQIIVAVWAHRDRVRFIYTAVLLLLAYFPWIWSVYNSYQSNLEQNLNWQAKPGLSALLQFAAALHQPFYFQMSSLENAVSIWTLPVLLISILGLSGLVMAEKEVKFRATIMSFFVIVPLLTAFIVSWVSPYSVWGNRHLTIIFLPYFFLVAIGLRQFAFRNWLYAGLAIVFIGAGIFHLQRPKQNYIWCGWADLARQIQQTQVSASTDVYAFEDLIAYQLWFELEKQSAGKFQIAKVNDFPDIPEDKAYFLPRGFDAVKTISSKDINGARFWLAVRDIANNPEHPLWLYMRDKGYTKGQTLRFDGAGGAAFLIEFQKAQF
jgi:uncharacterized membrane protein